MVAAPPAEVWRALLDPDTLATVIPGCRRLDRLGDNSYRAEVSLGVGPIRGRFEASVALSELDPPHAVRLSGALSGPLGASSGGGRVRLNPEGGSTRVHYDYRVEISGKVAAVGGRMLDGATRIVIGQFFERLAAEIGGGRPCTPWWRRLLTLLGIGR